ncbi:TPA: hypothetical protein ACJ2X1_000378 [Yersinia enterocolitica]
MKKIISTEATEATRSSKNYLAFRKFTSNLCKLDHDRLSKQWPFWISIFSPLIISILLSIPLWVDTTLDISANGYNKFLSIYRLPIGVLSLSIPLVAIVAHIHRTIQTAEQLNAARKKNIADSFFSHHKFITDALTKVAPRKVKISNKYCELKIEDPFQIYNIFFKESSYDDGVNTSRINIARNEIITLLDDVNTEIKNASEKSTSDTIKIKKLNKLIKSIAELTSFLAITNRFPDNDNIVKYAMDDKKVARIITFYHNENELKKYLASVFYFIKKVCLIINIEIEINITSVIYSAISNNDYYYFEEVFTQTLATKENTGYRISTNLNGELGSEYLRQQTIFKG